MALNDVVWDDEVTDPNKPKQAQPQAQATPNPANVQWDNAEPESLYNRTVWEDTGAPGYQEKAAPQPAPDTSLWDKAKSVVGQFAEDWKTGADVIQNNPEVALRDTVKFNNEVVQPWARRGFMPVSPPEPVDLGPEATDVEGIVKKIPGGLVNLIGSPQHMAEGLYKSLVEEPAQRAATGDYAGAQEIAKENYLKAAQMAGDFLPGFEAYREAAKTGFTEAPYQWHEALGKEFANDPVMTAAKIAGIVMPLARAGETAVAGGLIEKSKLAMAERLESGGIDTVNAARIADRFVETEIANSGKYRGDAIAAYKGLKAMREATATPLPEEVAAHFTGPIYDMYETDISRGNTPAHAVARISDTMAGERQIRESLAKLTDERNRAVQGLVEWGNRGEPIGGPVDFITKGSPYAGQEPGRPTTQAIEGDQPRKQIPYQEDQYNGDFPLQAQEETRFITRRTLEGRRPPAEPMDMTDYEQAATDARNIPREVTQNAPILRDTQGQVRQGSAEGQPGIQSGAVEGGGNLRIQGQEPQRGGEVLADGPQAQPHEVNEVIPQHVTRTIETGRDVPDSVVIKTKAENKKNIIDHIQAGEIDPNTTVLRMTDHKELGNILDTGRLTEGSDFEGRAGISAQDVGNGKPVMGYGDGISVGIVIPKERVIGRGIQPNEVKIDPNTPVGELRFTIDGLKGVYTAEQVRAEMAAKRATEGRPTPAAEPVRIDTATADASPLKEYADSLKNQGGKTSLHAELTPRTPADENLPHFQNIRRVREEISKAEQTLKDHGIDATIEHRHNEVYTLDPLKPDEAKLLRESGYTEKEIQDAIAANETFTVRGRHILYHGEAESGNRSHITLYKSASPSTVWHEVGHALEEHGRFPRAKLKGESLARDFESLSEGHRSALLNAAKSRQHPAEYQPGIPTKPEGASIESLMNKEWGDLSPDEQQRISSQFMDENGGPAQFSVAKNERGGIRNPFSKTPKVDVGNPQINLELTKWEKTRRAAEDLNIVLKKLTGEVERRYGVKLPYEMDVYAQKDMYPRQQADMVRRSEQEKVDFLKRAIDQKINMKDLDTLLQAQHAIERNAAMNAKRAEAGKPPQDGLSGMTDAEAQKVITKYQGNKNMQEMAQEARDMARDTLLMAEDMDLITPKEAAAYRAGYKNYVPLYRDLEGVTTGMGLGKGMDVKGPEFKAARGSLKEATSILGNIFYQRERMLTHAMQNEIGKTIDTLTTQYPELKDFFKIEQAGQGGGSQFRLKDEVIGFKKGGIQHYITTTPDLARALKNLDLQKLHPAIRALRSVLGFWQGLQTRWRPEFLITNFERDFGEALINLGVERGQLSAQGKGLRREVIKTLFKSQREIWQHERGKGTPQTEEFFNLGGDTGHFWMQEHQKASENLYALEKQLKGEGWDKVKNPLRAGLDVVDALQSSVELGIRYATYKALVRRGMDKMRAIQSAADLTVNFSRQGELTPFLKAFYGFINPSIQGISKMVRVLSSKKGRGAVMSSAAGLTALGFGIGMLSHMLGGDDDNKIPDPIKNSKMTFSLGNGKSITLWSMPYGWMPFYAAGRNMADMTYGNKPVKQAANSMMESLAKSFSPIDMTGALGYAFIPTLVRPMADVEGNKSWTGHHIYPDEMTQKGHNYTSYFKDTSKAAIATAATIHGLTGLDVHPGSLEYLQGAYLGGPAGFAVDSSESVINALQGKYEANRVPFARQFYREQVDKRPKTRQSIMRELRRKRQIQREDEG